jgi:hypothetical protein
LKFRQGRRNYSEEKSLSVQVFFRLVRSYDPIGLNRNRNEAIVAIVSCSSLSLFDRVLCWYPGSGDKYIVKTQNRIMIENNMLPACMQQSTPCRLDEDKIHVT